MTKKNLDQYKFPSGRPISAARNDAKKLARTEQIPLHQALNRIATLNGGGSGWEEFIASLNAPEGKQSSRPANLLQQALVLAQRALRSETQGGNAVFALGALRLAELFVPCSDFLFYELCKADMNYFLELCSLDGIRRELQHNGYSTEQYGTLQPLLDELQGQPSGALFLGYLTKTLRQVGAKVTFLDSPPGRGKTTALYLLLGDAVRNTTKSLSVYVARAGSDESLKSAMPHFLHQDTTVVPAKWNGAGDLIEMTLPTNPKKIMAIRVPAGGARAASIQQTLALLQKPLSSPLAERINWIGIDDFCLRSFMNEMGHKAMQDNLNSLLDQHKPFGDKQIVIAVDGANVREQVSGAGLTCCYRVIEVVAPQPSGLMPPAALKAPLPKNMCADRLALIEDVVLLVNNRNAAIPKFTNPTAKSLFNMLGKITSKSVGP